MLKPPPEFADKNSIDETSAEQNFANDNSDFYGLENNHKDKKLEEDFAFYDNAIMEDEISCSKKKLGDKEFENEASYRCPSKNITTKDDVYNTTKWDYIEPRIFVRYSNGPDDVPVELLHDLDHKQVKRDVNMGDNSMAQGVSENNASIHVNQLPSQNRKNRNRRLVLYGTLIILSLFIGCVLLAYRVFGPTKNHNVDVALRASSDDPTLKQVVILFRHGDRTPTETYTKDPHSNYSWQGDGWGVLRKSGMKRMHKLGQWIRYNYGWLNDGKFTHKNTFVESSPVDRCIESTQALLSGLYPVDPKDAFVEDLLWRPIPVHTVPSKFDKVIIGSYTCPKLKVLLAEAHKETMTEQVAQFLDEVSQVVGEKMDNITSIEFLYNTLQIEVAEGLKLPAEVKKYYDDPRMIDITRASYAIFTHFEEQKRLLGGPLLNKVIENMENVDKGSSNYKIYLYGVHDITLVNLLRTMGIDKYDGQLLKPGLGATLIFELRKNDTENATVKVSYMDDSATELPVPLVIPDCTANVCKGELKNLSLQNLRFNYEKVIPKDRDRECQV